MAAGRHEYLNVAQPPRPYGEGRVSPRVGGTYDRFVAAMRVVLPAIALALALLTVGWPAFNPHEFSFMLAIDKVRLSPERLRLEQPRYYGADTSQRPFLIEAASAIQENTDTEKVTLNDIHAAMTLKDGVEVNSRANQGVYYPERRTLGLDGAVEVVASNGYRIVAADAAIDLETHRVTSASPVVGTGPLGHFEAAGFDADLDQDKLTFVDGVHARIVPRPGDSATSDEAPGP